MAIVDIPKFDALVIGAGPAGGTAALMLARAGFTVAVVEKTVFPRRKVCGEYVSATSFDLFERLGLLDEYVSHAGPPVKTVGIFSAHHILTAPMPSSGRRSNRWGRALQRDVLDSWLLEKAVETGVVAFQPFTAININGEPGDLVVRLESKETREIVELGCRFVIAAHGSWETGTLPTQSTKKKSTAGDLLAFKTHFCNTKLETDLMPLLVFPGGYGGMVHCRGGEVSVSCCIERTTLQALRRDSPGQKAGDVVFDHIRETTTGFRDALTGATHDEEWLAAGPIRPGFRSRHDNGVFVVGNAAGESHPAIAEGISMAMQSSWLLCNKLARVRNPNKAALAHIAAEYDRDWKKAFSRRIRAARLFAYLSINSPGHSAMAKALTVFPSLLTAGAKLSGKMNRVVLDRSTTSQTVAS